MSINLLTVSAEDIIKEAEKCAKDLKEAQIKTHQVRNVYGEINSIKMEFVKSGKVFTDLIRTKIILLKPKLAYLAGREPKARPFKSFMDGMIDSYSFPKTEKTEKTEKEEGDNLKAFNNFLDVMESIVAYHKFYEKN